MARVLGLLCLLLAGAAPPAERQRREEQRLEGTWRVIAAEAGGAAVPSREYRGLRLTFRAGKFTARRGDEQPQQGSYTLDAGKDPREMDIVRRVEGRDYRQLAIYSLTGSSLRICGSTEERPTAFDTRDHPDWTLLTLRRAD
jgi:uncharacterized protein (TIGR03067 family)